MKQEDNWYNVVERLRANSLTSYQMGYYECRANMWETCACGQICDKKRFTTSGYGIRMRTEINDPELEELGLKFSRIWAKACPYSPEPISQPEAAEELSKLLAAISEREAQLRGTHHV